MVAASVAATTSAIFNRSLLPSHDGQLSQIRRSVFSRKRGKRKSGNNKYERSRVLHLRCGKVVEFFLRAVALHGRE